MLGYFSPHFRVAGSRGGDKGHALKLCGQLLGNATLTAARTSKYERDRPVAPQLHIEKSGFGRNDYRSVLANLPVFNQKSEAMKCSSIFPSKSIQRVRGRLAGFLTDASSSSSSLPRVFPVASFAPALRAHSGGAAPDFHRLPD